jgi:hypothetical protein
MVLVDEMTLQNIFSFKATFHSKQCYLEYAGFSEILKEDSRSCDWFVDCSLQ